jgi:CBS-domain-containing membrane protein
MMVREMMSFPVRTCLLQDSLERAAQMLWEHDCGVLPVIDSEGHIGALITDRDICMAAYTRGQRLADLRVADSMSRSIVTCRSDEDVTVAAQLMVENCVRRLPIVDADGKLCGLLSLNDLAVGAAKNPALGREALRVLGAVCSHRTRAEGTENTLAPTASTMSPKAATPAMPKAIAGGAKS